MAQLPTCKHGFLADLVADHTKACSRCRECWADPSSPLHGRFDQAECEQDPSFNSYAHHAFQALIASIVRRRGHYRDQDGRQELEAMLRLHLLQKADMINAAMADETRSLSQRYAYVRAALQHRLENYQTSDDAKVNQDAAEFKDDGRDPRQELHYDPREHLEPNGAGVEGDGASRAHSRTWQPAQEKPKAAPVKLLVPEIRLSQPDISYAERRALFEEMLWEIDPETGRRYDPLKLFKIVYPPPPPSRPRTLAGVREILGGTVRLVGARDILSGAYSLRKALK